MATYDKEIDYEREETFFKLKEHVVYGSSRVGIRTHDIDLLGLQTQGFSMRSVHYSIGSRQYELTNHLGNVLSVVSDKVIPNFDHGVITEMWADIRVAQDYSPFGVTLSRRNFSVSEGYRYGMGGHEKDNEIKGEGNHYSFGNYGYDPRGARRWNIDPVINPSLSPYAVFNNNPIWFIDVDGRRPEPVQDGKFKGFAWRIGSGFGPRKVDETKRKGKVKASSFHKGTDINSGAGNHDFGAIIVATHDGIVNIKDNTEGTAGRMITITSPDGTFVTQYLHLSSISVVDGQKVTENTPIGLLGSSAGGKEDGTDCHLHYQIGLVDKGKIELIDPQIDKSLNRKKLESLVDPQMWVNGTYEVGTINPVKVQQLEEIIVRPNTTSPQENNAPIEEKKPGE